MYVLFESLQGKILSDVIVNDNLDEIIFVTDDNKRYKLHHSQDCCESVYIESIVGDVKDLIGNPILIAREHCGSNIPPLNSDENPYDREESYTWSFYCIATVKGYVDIRWIGSSNGYYSESVDFDEE